MTQWAADLRGCATLLGDSIHFCPSLESCQTKSRLQPVALRSFFPVLRCFFNFVWFDCPLEFLYRSSWAMPDPDDGQITNFQSILSPLASHPPHTFWVICLDLGPISIANMLWVLHFGEYPPHPTTKFHRCSATFLHKWHSYTFTILTLESPSWPHQKKSGQNGTNHPVLTPGRCLTSKGNWPMLWHLSIRHRSRPFRRRHPRWSPKNPHMNQRQGRSFFFGQWCFGCQMGLRFLCQIET